MALTAKQRKLMAEIRAISEIAGLDHWNIDQYKKGGRTTQLDIIKHHLVRGRIIMRYTLIDDMLACIIVNKYFRLPKKNPPYPRLWETKSFRVFNHHILDNLYLIHKLKVVHDLRPVSPKVRDIIERVNAVRNAIAHSLFPMNRYQYRFDKKVTYRSYNIFTLAGFTLIEMESQQVVDYLQNRAFGIRSKSLTAIKDKRPSARR